MEKISDRLNKFKDISTTKELESYKSSLVDELYQSKYVRRFLDSNSLDSEFVSKHIIELLDMSNSALPCQVCPGYLKCPNSPKGYVKTFNLEKDIIEYCVCKKLREIQPIKNNYLMVDFPSEWYYNSIEKLATNTFTKSLVPSLTNILSSSLKGLFLYGPSGCGKSYIASCFANSYILTTNKKVVFINFRKLLDSIKSSFDEDNNYMQETIFLLKDIDLLVIDDLGSEKASEWSTYQILFDVLQDRLRNHKLTFITSLFSLNDLRTLYGGNNPKTNRLIDLIKMLTDEKLIEGINYNTL